MCTRTVFSRTRKNSACGTRAIPRRIRLHGPHTCILSTHSGQRIVTHHETHTNAFTTLFSPRHPKKQDENKKLHPHAAKNIGIYILVTHHPKDVGRGGCPYIATSNNSYAPSNPHSSPSAVHAHKALCHSPPTSPSTILADDPQYYDA